MRNYLHTDSYYSNAEISVYNFIEKASNIDLVQKSADYLQSEEKRLYAWVHKTNFKDFMEELRKIFAEAGEDRKVFEKFKKSNLNNIIKDPIGSVAEGQIVTITCEPLKDVYLDKFVKLIDTSNESFVISSNLDHKLEITFEYNSANIKNALNIIDKRRGRVKFNTESETMTYVNRTLNRLIKNNQIGKIEINGENEQIDITEEFTPERTNIFGYTKDTIKEAIANPTLRQELQTAKDLVYSFLQGIISNGSEDLKTSFQIVWDNKIGNSLEKFIFFSKGKNTSSGVGGALQEFAVAMLAEYVNIKRGRDYGGPIAEILGNIVEKGGEQPKTDVSILNRIGIQVKAYNQGSLNDNNGHARMMSTNIHPSGLDQGLLGYGLNIGDALVQACFNSSSDKFSKEYLADLIEEYALAQTMSFTTNKISVDTICFYFLDAEYLVPGSVILKQLSTTTPKVTIRGPDPLGDDEYFRQKGYTSYYELKDGTKKNQIVKEFVQFWRGDPYNLEPTEDNKKYYDKLYTKQISIDVKFNYKFMYNKEYSIFG